VSGEPFIGIATTPDKNVAEMAADVTARLPAYIPDLVKQYEDHKSSFK
jgi:hypothetical protein